MAHCPSPAIPQDRSRLHDALARLKVHDHLCLIYETREEQFAAIIPFIRMGLERGEKCVYIAEENSPAAILEALQCAGIDTEAAVASGALAVLGKQQAYLREGRFEPEAMIAFLGAAIAAARAEGFPALRASGEMTWALGEDIGGERLLEYEAKLNKFFPQQPIVAICQYNRRRFPPEVIREVIQTHPRVIHDGLICGNPFFIPPEEFLSPGQAAVEVERLLYTLAVREKAETELREREARHRSVIAAMAEGVIFQAADGRITEVNAAAERILGLTAAELIGKACDAPPWKAIREDGTPFPCERQPAMAALRSGRPLHDVTMGIHHPDGTLVWLSVNAQPLASPGQDVPGAVVTTFRDITLQKRITGLNLARLRLLQFASDHNLDEFLRAALDEAEKLTTSSIGFWHFLAEDQQTLSLQAWSTRTAAEFCRAEGKGRHYPLQEAGVWADCVRRREAVIHNDYAALEHRRGLPPGHAEVLRELTVPVMRGGEIVAIIGVGNKPQPYVQQDLEAVALLSDLVWDITERKRAEEALRTSELRAALLNRVAQIFLTVADKVLYREVAKVMAEALHCRLGLFGILDEQDALVFPALPRKYWRTWGFPGEPAPLPPAAWEGTLWGEALRQGRALRSPGADTVKRLPRPAHFLAVPVVSGTRSIGLLLVADSAAGYDDADQALLQTIAERIAPILETRRQRDRQEQKRRRAEARLKAAGAYNRSLIEASLDPLVTIDAEGHITDVNSATETATGYPRPDLVGTDFSDYFTDPERAREGYRRAFRDGQVHDYPLELRHRDGHLTPVMYNASVFRNEAGEVAGVFAAARDITELKRAQDELNILSSAIAQSPVSIVITDRKGNIEFVNPKFSQLTGYPAEEARGQNPRILKSGHTLPEEYQALWGTIGSGKIWEGELRNRKKNGDLFWEHATIAPVKDARQRITHYIAIKEDITERKLLEEQLRQAQKMEAIGQLAGGIAHDFNNILTAIIGYATLLEMRMPTEAPLRTNVAQIVAAAERAAELTRSLLTFSRKQAIKRQPLELNQAIRKTEQFLRRVIGEDIELATRLGAEPLVATVDHGQFDQVLMNLATNARDAMPCGGTVTISARSLAMDSEFIASHGFGRMGEYALISFADSGVGMDETTRQQVFQPFFTTKEVGRGTGLGLAMVYGMVKQHEGFIAVASTPGEGTTFDLYLPLAPEAAGINQLQVETKGVVLGGNEAILVADDDSSIRNLAMQVLTLFGYSVVCAADGEEALERFREYQDRLQLVILDAVMPKRSGSEVLERIRQLRPDIKALLISGYAADAIHRQQGIDPALEFVQKPMDPQALLKKVRQVLDREPQGHPLPLEEERP